VGLKRKVLRRVKNSLATIIRKLQRLVSAWGGEVPELLRLRENQKKGGTTSGRRKSRRNSAKGGVTGKPWHMPRTRAEEHVGPISYAKKGELEFLFRILVTGERKTSWGKRRQKTGCTGRWGGKE